MGRDREPWWVSVAWIGVASALGVGVILGLRLLFGADALVEMLMGPG